MKTIVNLGVIGTGGYLIYKNIMTLSTTKNKKDMVIPVLVLFVSAVAVYHSLPTLLGSTRLQTTDPMNETKMSYDVESLDEQLEG